MRKVILVIIASFLLLECSSRFYFYFSRGVPFFDMDKMIYVYYPELKGVEEEFYKDTSKYKLLVLGGSVVTADLYCDLGQEFLDKSLWKDSIVPSLKVFSLAKAGHTSLDSKIKSEFLSALPFDFVVFYHGINDSRANNIPPEHFNIDYKHFAFYDEVELCVIHKEKKWTILPFTFDFIGLKLKYFFSDSPKVPPYYIVIGDKVLDNKNWEYGEDVKTKASFKRNIQIIQNDWKQSKDHTLILLTFAYYHPENYSLKNFTDKKLDYKEQKWPTEIYGNPENVVKAIQVHNEVTKSFKGSPNTVVIDFNPLVPRSKLYFNDICHLTDSGCALMASTISLVLDSLIQSRPIK